ncbi:hypothetical protein F5Y14DRAFT_64338 [Nemania sp. NC0429]|nr:hypothetical protein F5Y14DRAFT_64338 [Nemania sp. NC0429]
MADGIDGTGSQPSPQYTGQRYLGHGDPNQEFMSIMTHYSYNGVMFYLLTSAVEEELPIGYDLETTIEGKLLLELNDLSWGTQSVEKHVRAAQIRRELAQLSGDACFPLMQELAPVTPLPEARTLQEYLYPTAYTLQVLSKDDKLVAHRLHDYTPPDEYLPIPDEELKDLDLEEDIPVFNASQVVLGEVLKHMVWKVDIDGEVMVCKVTFTNNFWNSLSDELAIYQKFRRAEDELLVPKLKGIVKSHTGVVGILLSYVSKKHHNLRVLLQDVGDGIVPEAAASPALKKKWAGQIKHTVSQLHGLGILWGDVKTDNVLIDDNDDAIIVDFGGLNTVGWIDADKHGTVKGDMQGLEKILEVLGAE